MVRTVVTPSNQDVSIHLPKNYIGKKVEVIAFTIDETDEESTKTADNSKKTMADFWGTISDETAKKLHDGINNMRNEWESGI